MADLIKNLIDLGQIETSNLKPTFSFTPHKKPILDMAIPLGRETQVFTLATDNTVKIYDLASGEQTADIFLEDQPSCFCTVDQFIIVRTFLAPQCSWASTTAASVGTTTCRMQRILPWIKTKKLTACLILNWRLSRTSFCSMFATSNLSSWQKQGHVYSVRARSQRADELRHRRVDVHVHCFRCNYFYNGQAQEELRLHAAGAEAGLFLRELSLRQWNHQDQDGGEVLQQVRRILTQDHTRPLGCYASGADVLVDQRSTSGKLRE